jgi:hypothetical protein
VVAPTLSANESCRSRWQQGSAWREGQDRSVGASSWDYRTEFDGDIAAALAALQAEVFADRYSWADDEQYDGVHRRRYASIEELWQDEDIQESGTHTILDVCQVVGPGDPDDYGTVRPLTPTEAGRLLGTEKPTPEDFDRAVEEGTLPDLTPRWSACCMPLFVDGQPTEIAFWGHSGD